MNNGIFNGTKQSQDLSISPVINLTADVDNLFLPSQHNLIRLASSASYTITGISSRKDRVYNLYNIGTYDIIIANMSSFSLANNRVLSATGGDLLLSPNDNITIFYDDFTNVWRTVGVVKTVVTAVNATIYDFTVSSAPSSATSTTGAPLTAGWSFVLPSNAKYINIDAIGAGAGGGSGRRGAAGTNRGGGGGGGAGGRSNYSCKVSSLSSQTLIVCVGYGSAGGASVTVNNTDGNGSGAFGGSSRVDVGTLGNSSLCLGFGGSNGGGGTTSGGSNGGPVWTSTYLPGNAGAGGASTPTGSDGGYSIQAPSPGAGGGGISSSDVGGAGGTARGNEVTRGAALTSAGGSIGNPGIPGVVASTSNIDGGGGGGGGGGAGLTSAAGNGGDGGFPGGGAGGGGASLNGYNSGAGGNGANGLVRIVVWS